MVLTNIFFYILEIFFDNLDNNSNDKLYQGVSPLILNITNYTTIYLIFQLTLI